MKKFCIIMGSAKPSGNTAELLKPFVAELETNGCEVAYIRLADRDIKACGGCFACQHVADVYGCPIKDDVADIMDEIIASNCVVFATPIYTWFCTPSMKALLDRHFGLNKFYGKAAHGSLWAGKQVALITTHGYEADNANEPFERAIKNLCKHSKLEYRGIHSARDIGGLADFQTKEVVDGAKAFAQQLLK